MSAKLKLPWRPAIYRRTYTRVPEVGSVIAIDGKGWRILRIEDMNPGNWSERADRYWAKCAKAGQNWEAWDRRPRKVYAQPLAGADGRSYSMIIEPDSFPSWYVLPEHYAVCALCGDLAPCLAHESAEQAEREMKTAEKRMAIMDGCCPACGELITSRQKTIVFPGPNVWNPFGSSPVVFHERRKCRSQARSYEDDWVKVEPGRKRTWLTAFCEGTRIMHNDGYEECVGTGDVDCPGLRCQHRAWTRCYAQSHGCGRCQTGGSNGE